MNQLKAGSVLSYVIIALNALVGLLYTPFMLGVLGQNQYGLYSLVASIIAYLTLLDFGFGPAVVRYTAKYRAEGKTEEQYALFGLFFTLYSIIGLVAFGIGLLLYFNIDWLFDRTMTPEDLSQARTMILLLLFNLAFTFPMSVFGSIITAYERFIFQKTVQILRIVLSTGVLIGVLLVGYKAVALVVVQTVFNVLLLSSNFLYCKKELKIKLHFTGFSWPFVRQILGFSVWVFLGDIMFKFYYNTGQFVLGATSGTVEVALFALGVTLMQMYIMFSGGISGVLLPKITSMVTLNKSKEDISDLFIRIGRIQYIIMALILVGFVILGKPFIVLWAGAAYSSVYYIGLFFFLSTIIPLIQNTAIVILQARNQQKFRSLMLVVVGAVSLVAQVILSKYYGAIGCAVAVGAANIVGQGIILNWYYHKKQGLDIIKFWKEIGKISVVPGLMALVGFWLVQNVVVDSWDKFLLFAFITLLVYSVLIYRFSLSMYERELILAPIRAVKSKFWTKCYGASKE